MIQINDGSITANYTYNGNGQRAKKNVNGVNTIFHYNLSGQIIAESNSAGSIAAEYVYLNSQPLTKMEGSVVYYYHNDHLATPQKMTDASGTVVWSADYKPFGEATVTVSTITNNLRFPGQYYDAETGSNYNYYRDYDPTIGRYISKDPIGFDGEDTNLYAYVGNNPTTFVDPLGLSRLTLNNGTLYVYPGGANTQGPPQAFPAGNNTVNPQGNPYTQNSYAPLPAGTFPVGPFIPTGNDPNSGFGNGFFPITLPPAPPLPPGVQGPPSPPRTGTGIHSGRANRGGPNARTLGCVRTTSQAINVLRNDPPTSITIQCGCQ